MSKWLNNKYLWYKSTLEKPCNKLHYCPYGQLVEEFPLAIDEAKEAIKKGLYKSVSRKPTILIVG